MSNKLPPYDPDAKCVKCGSEDVTTSFHQTTTCSFDHCDRCHNSTDCEGPSLEHFKRYCRNCLYKWVEATLDAKTKGATR